MHPDRAELSSIHASLDLLRERLVGIADRHDARSDDARSDDAPVAGVATELFEVDRSLRNALRQLDRAMTGLR